MKPPVFDYERPETVEQTLAALARHGGSAKLLAGGQSLIPMLNLRLVQPERLIDIGRIRCLRSIARIGDELRIGAMATHNEILGSPDVARDCPLIIEAYQQVAHHSIRNRGTLGGSLCHNDPSAEMPLVAALLSATLVARSTAGERRIPAEQFFLGLFATALHPDELLVEIVIPVPPKGHGWSFQEISQRHGDFALLAGAAMLTVKDGLCHDVRIGYRNVGTWGGRLACVEAIVEGQAPTPSLFDQAAEAARAAIDPPSDIHADADYRRDVAGTLTKRALAAAVARAQ